jgi:hypothetical protein
MIRVVRIQLFKILLLLVNCSNAWHLIGNPLSMFGYSLFIYYLVNDELLNFV